MIFGQARSRSVLTGLDNHMITGAVPVPLSGYPWNTPGMTVRHSSDRANPVHAMPLGMPPATHLITSRTAPFRS